MSDERSYPATGASFPGQGTGASSPVTPGNGSALGQEEQSRRPRRKGRVRVPKLPEEFIEAAFQVCSAEGPDAITARRVARQMNVSAMAMYRHFQNMDHLKAATRNLGFARLSDALTEVYTSAKDPQDQLRRAFKAYVSFAQSYPGVYLLMFATGPGPEQFGEENLGIQAAQQLMNIIVSSLGLVPPQSDPETEKAVFYAWFLLHGLTVFAISGIKDRLTSMPIDDLIEACVDRLMRSFSNEPPQQ